VKIKIKKTERVFDDFFKIDQAVLQYEKFDGSMTPDLIRLNFNRGHSVAVLLYNENQQTVILTDQFRYPAYVGDPKRGWILEIVAGMLEPGEPPTQSAIREVYEETGFRVHEPEPICEFFVSPGGTSEKIYLFFAKVTDGAQQGTGGGVSEEYEDIRIKQVPLDKALRMIHSGDICDAKTIIALQWLEKKVASSAVAFNNHPESVTNKSNSAPN